MSSYNCPKTTAQLRSETGIYEEPDNHAHPGRQRRPKVKVKDPPPHPPRYKNHPGLTTLAQILVFKCTSRANGTPPNMVLFSGFSLLGLVAAQQLQADVGLRKEEL